MAATERVVVLLTPEQKSTVVKRARAEKLSLSDYMRRRALGNEEPLAALLEELKSSTAQAIRAVDESLARSERLAATQAERDEQARERARAEFSRLDPEVFAQVLTP